MKKRNFKSLLALGLVSGLVLAACGTGDETSEDATDNGSGEVEETEDFSIVMVTDIGGVDDGSFNQSAWEGMQAWGAEHGYSENEGFAYIQSDDDSQFVTNLNTALNNDFDVIFGIGYILQPSMAEVAAQNPDQHFVIVDEVIEEDNVQSVLFKDHEAAFLAGVAAAESTQTGQVGFVGGMESPVIDRFEAGFAAGVAAVDDSVEVDVEYVGSFGDAARAKQIAAAMYSAGSDIIYHASGESGNGVFSEARDRMNDDPSQELWVIGVDLDQSEQGEYDSGNLTLTSTLKGVGTAVQEIAEQAFDGNFAGGTTTTFGLAEDGVGLTEGQLSEEAWASVEDFKQQIIDGDIVVPETLDE